LQFGQSLACLAQRQPTRLYAFLDDVAVVLVDALLDEGWLSTRYDELTGRPPEARRTSPWLRSMRGEREEFVRRRHRVSAVERLVVLSVVACVLTLEFWFFFLAGSSLPQA
jgi:hypothetical protein